MGNIIINILESFLGKCHNHNEDSGQSEFDCPACAEDKGLAHGNSDGKHKLAVNYQRNIFRCWRCGFENNMHGKLYVSNTEVGAQFIVSIPLSK